MGRDITTGIDTTSIMEEAKEQIKQKRSLNDKRFDISRYLKVTTYFACEILGN
jgi:hypothetical protein